MRGVKCFRGFSAEMSNSYKIKSKKEEDGKKE